MKTTLLLAGLLVLTAGCVTNAPVMPIPVAAQPPRVEVGGTEATATSDMRAQLREQEERARMLAAYATDSTRGSLEQNARRNRYGAVDDWQAAAVAAQDSLIVEERAKIQAEGIAKIQNALAQGLEDQATTAERLLEAITKLAEKIQP